MRLVIQKTDAQWKQIAYSYLSPFFQNYLILIYTRNYYVTLYPGPICNYPINPYCKLSLCL
jgi:hypothetical protein